MIHISTFSGIGGFDLASEWMGWKNYVSCEINSFPRKVLQHYWADAYHHDDIKTLTYQKINEELTERFGSAWRSDDVILTGGFPCQPFSDAGKRKGTEDDRHLWPEMLRAIQEIKPTFVVGENVRGLITWNGGLVFDQVQSDLEAIGYEVWPFLLPASGVNAPHQRYRIWFVAYSSSSRWIDGCDNRKRRSFRADFGASKEDQQKWKGRFFRACETGEVRIVTDTDRQRSQRSKNKGRVEKGRKNRKEQSMRFLRTNWEKFPTEPPLRDDNDGLSSELDGITLSKFNKELLMAGGNAIVPQVALQIFKSIELFNNQLL